MSVPTSPAPVIDSHQHFWLYDARTYGWIDETMTALRRDFLPDDLGPLLTPEGVDATIAVQARQDEEETAWLLDLASRYGFIRGVVGWVDLQAADVESRVERLADTPRLVGVRHVVQAEPDGFLHRAAFHRGMKAVERCDLVYDVLIYARQLPEAVRFVTAFPRQRFVLDHLGKPDVRGNGLLEWSRRLQELAEVPQVWCKLSGLVTEADWQSWTPAGLRPYLDTALDAFGPSRLMFGSDWPVCTVAASYHEVLALVREAISEYSADEQAQMLGRTAEEVYLS